MGSASSRQKITQPLFDATSSLLRRTKIWDNFQMLVQRIKTAVGYGSPRPQAIETGGNQSAEHLDSSSEGQATTDHQDDGGQASNEQQIHIADDGDRSSDVENLENNNLSSDSTAQNGDEIAKDEVQREARDSAEDDKLVENITKAMEEAAPRWSAMSKTDEQPRVLGQATDKLEPLKSDDIAIATNDETPSKVESQSVIDTRKIYESRLEGLNAVYSRVVPKSTGLPKSKANPAGPVDDYDNQVTEYVYSSLMVALPEAQVATPGAGIAFQPPVDNKPESKSVHSEPKSGSTGLLAEHIVSTEAAGQADSAVHTDTSEYVSDDGTFEPEVETVIANYRTWDRELYSGLRLNRTTIRLVEILPGALGDEVFLRLSVHLLNDVVMQYEALSYVWGNPEPAKQVFVNDVKVSVNPNLYDALISLRHSDSTRCIWIDAICLNQQSPAEKSKEVQKMGQIYSLAKTVNVFLGATSPNNSSSIDNFLRFVNRDDRERAADRYADEGLKGLEGTFEGCKTNVRDVCKGFVEACLQPWWGRIWTLQEFYLAKEEPTWYWGRTYASNSSLKRDFNLLTSLVWDLYTHKDSNEHDLSDLEARIAKPIGAFKVDISRISALISRRYRTDGFDTPRRLYRELTARATDPHDFVYGLRAIFDPVFGRVFVPDYLMRTELLFACLTVFLVQFECWGDVLWWYPTRYEAGTGRRPSWLPNFTQHIVPHELDVKPLDQSAEEKPEPKLLVLNHRLHAEGYNVDKVYAHRHVHASDNQKIFEELWQFDHCMNHNQECEEYFYSNDSQDLWFKTFFEMHEGYYAKFTHFNSAFRGALIRSTVKPEDGDKFPRYVVECIPSWDLLQWHALRVRTPGLLEALGHDLNDDGPGLLDNIFSSKMDTIFRDAFASFFIGACLFDWGHLSVWLKRFPTAKQWSNDNDKYWTETKASPSDETEKRKKAIVEAYSGYESDVWPEVSKVSWCYSFYYTLFAYLILLECDDHTSITNLIPKLQAAGDKLRTIYFGTTPKQIEELASKVPSVANRVSYHNIVIDLFRGRYLFWTNGGFRGISSPGVEICCDKKSIVAIVDGLSFPIIVRDYEADTGEGWLAGCVLIRGIDMLGRDADKAGLPLDYNRGEKQVFKFR